MSQQQKEGGLQTGTNLTANHNLHRSQSMSKLHDFDHKDTSAAGVSSKCNKIILEPSPLHTTESYTCKSKVYISMSNDC